VKVRSVRLERHALHSGEESMREFILSVSVEESQGGYSAECHPEKDEAIFVEGDIWEELRASVTEAISLYFREFPDRLEPIYVRLCLARESVWLWGIPMEYDAIERSPVGIEAECLPMDPSRRLGFLGP
jgi:hypothetical protein